MSARVLVTGGSGFIGTWVLHELLQRNLTAVVIDLHPAHARWQELLGDRAREVVWAKASLTDRDSLSAVIQEHQVSYIIHLAALLTPDCQQRPWDGCRVNVLGSTTVFDAARACASVHAISYASSYAVYGDQATEHPKQHHAPTFYGAFKLAVDSIAEQYWRHFEVRSVAVRPHVVYGPLRELGLTAGPSLAVKAAVQGHDYRIGYTGTVAYDYVEDVARAFVRSALECPPGATVVDLPGERATTHDFANAIREVCPDSSSQLRVEGPQIPANVPATPHYITNLFSDWVATTLRDGVQQTADFYRRKNTP